MRDVLSRHRSEGQEPGSRSARRGVLRGLGCGRHSVRQPPRAGSRSDRAPHCQSVRATQARALYGRHLGSTPVTDSGASSCGAGGFSATGSAAAVIGEAAKWFGTPYSWGGGTLDGPSLRFAQGAGTVGFEFAATAAHTVETGSPALSLLQPGDLLFWGSSAGSIHHVALYVGNGQMVDEAHTGTVASQRAVYDGDFYAATRVLNP